MPKCGRAFRKRTTTVRGHVSGKDRSLLTRMATPEPIQNMSIALRQCITRIRINKPAREIKLTLRRIPTGNLEATNELTVAIDRPTVLTA